MASEFPGKINHWQLKDKTINNTIRDIYSMAQLSKTNITFTLVVLLIVAFVLT